jgi:hypothetical protein
MPHDSSLRVVLKKTPQRGATTNAPQSSEIKTKYETRKRPRSATIRARGVRDLRQISCDASAIGDAPCKCSATDAVEASMPFRIDTYSMPDATRRCSSRGMSRPALVTNESSAWALPSTRATKVRSDR